MATIVTRAGKGSPLTHNEVDDNFTNLNTDKAETSALAAVATSGVYSDLISKPTLGTAAATDTTAYATAAQGSLADSALQGNQTITFSGDATGSGTTSIVVTVVDDSHNHVISNVDGLQTALDAKQPTGAYLTGNQTITLSGDLSGSGTTSINAQIAANVVNANELNVVGNGTATQFLRSDADGSFTWAVPTDTNTTYSAGTGLALTGTVFSNTITNNNQLTNGAGYTTYTSNQATSTTSSVTFNVVTATTFNTTSDIRLKDNIRTFESAMDVVSQLRGVRFAWKETGVETVGLIAQEVEKVLPELIGTNADTGLKSVSYANMVAVLIEAVKELKAEIEELKKR